MRWYSWDTPVLRNCSRSRSADDAKSMRRNNIIDIFLRCSNGAKINFRYHRRFFWDDQLAFIRFDVDNILHLHFNHFSVLRNLKDIMRGTILRHAASKFFLKKLFSILGFNKGGIQMLIGICEDNPVIREELIQEIQCSAEVMYFV